MVATPNTTGTSEWRTVRIEILEKIEDLPSLSNVVSEFLRLTRQPFFTAKDFENVICKDQALVARLLKVANSGMYGKSRSIKTIPEAVVLIGLENLQKIVFAVSSSGLLTQELQCYNYDPGRGFWLHSMAVAMAARSLTMGSNNCVLKGEEAFVAGLLHDTGKLVIDGFLDHDASPHEVSLEEEISACGLTHAELAEHVFKRWNLPDVIVDAVQGHHLENEESWEHVGAVLIHMAQAICHTWNIGRETDMDLGEDIDPEEFERHIEVLQLQKNKLPQIFWEIRQNLASLDDLYPAEGE